MRPERSDAGNGRALRSAAGVVLGLGLLWAGAGGLAGQGTQTLDQGTYVLRVDGRRVGTEAFAIRREGREIKAVGRVSLDAETSLTPVEVWLQTDPDYRPDLFRLRPGSGELQSVTAVREEQRMRLQISTEAGDRFKEFMTPAEASVVEPRIAHHYFLVLRQHGARLEESGTVRVPVVVPSRSERFTLALRREGHERVEAAGAIRSATRYAASVDGEEISVWADADGRILRLEIPSRNFTAVRAREEG